MNPASARWVAAAKLLAVDPTLKVRCPAQDDGDLLVHDEQDTADTTRFERYLVCEACGARNVMRMRTPKEETVWLVVESTPGRNVGAMASDGHVWVVDTPYNRAEVEELWRMRDSAALSDAHAPDVTLFRAPSDDSAAAIVSSILDAVAEHHPSLTILKIVGAPDTQAVRYAVAAHRFRVALVRDNQETWVK